MATNSPTVMPRINISYSIFVQFLSKINKGIFRDASIDALGKVQKVHQAQSRFLIWYPDLTAVVLGPAKPPSHRYPSQNEIDELLGDLRSVSDFLFDTEHRFSSGQENERNMLKPLEEVTASLERQLDCIQLAINKLNPYRVPKDIYGMYHGVLVTPSWPKLTKRMAPVGLRNR
ncbi:hypothetical protein FOYG_13785 [Fusarium oxysporum NRRL 32931]|uniref:Uncharacterized protein n=1 Tax=Fusarium oxysporum NRRL 32931 TaxID=660029 RepID=W9HT52_FUSOX|nr:hypothetical protein FOYG_13785 [Fusarium oxysporum NRRL 32931]